MLTKEQIRAAQDRPREWVPIKEWTPEGETFDPKKHGVYVGTLSSKERDLWEQELIRSRSADPKANLLSARVKFAVLAVQDEAGNRLLTDDDATWLAEKSAPALSKVTNVAIKLNKISAKDRKELTAAATAA